MHTSILRARIVVVRLVAMLALLAGAAVSVAPVSEAQTNPYQRGPNPTSSLVNGNGPYAVSRTTVSSFVSGFGGGTIYYPTTTSDGTFGGVAISPGFTGTQSTISWLGPRLASHGFVVITIDTNSVFDFPSSRASQLMAALNYLANSSSVRTRVDGSRLAVMGHSMGGGGSLIAARNNPQLQAAIPLAPWNTSSSFSTVRVPTLVVACENDTVASVSSHASPMYNSIPSSSEKAFLEINNGSHFCPNSTNTSIGRYAVTWLKRFVDNDTRYEPYLCGTPHQSYLGSTTQVSEYRQTCPH